MDHLHVRTKSKFPWVRGLINDFSGQIEGNKMFSSGQIVPLWSAIFNREDALCISSSSEGFSLSIGADFSGKPRTFRLC
jgi:hypothetical protein